MDEKSGYGKDSKEVTEVISRNIAAGYEKDYDDWLQRFMMSERPFPGSRNDYNCPWREYLFCAEGASRTRTSRWFRINLVDCYLSSVLDKIYSEAL